MQAHAVVRGTTSARQCTVIEGPDEELRDGCRDLAQGDHGGERVGMFSDASVGLSGQLADRRTCSRRAALAERRQDY